MMITVLGGVMVLVACFCSYWIGRYDGRVEGLTKARDILFENYDTIFGTCLRGKEEETKDESRQQ